MAIFNSYVAVYQRVILKVSIQFVPHFRALVLTTYKCSIALTLSHWSMVKLSSLTLP